MAVYGPKTGNEIDQIVLGGRCYTIAAKTKNRFYAVKTAFQQTQGKRDVGKLEPQQIAKRCTARLPPQSLCINVLYIFSSIVGGV